VPDIDEAIPRSRSEFRKLAKERLKDSKALLDSGNYSGSYYICGYAVECALKAIIAKNIKPNMFPHREFGSKCWTHNLGTLTNQAGLTALLKIKQKADPKFNIFWSQTVVKWNEHSRYNIKRTERDARELYIAVSDTDHGVLTWLANYW
jgi:HEPN domain-containing protein